MGRGSRARTARRSIVGPRRPRDERRRRASRRRWSRQSQCDRDILSPRAALRRRFRSTCCNHEALAAPRHGGVLAPCPRGLRPRRRFFRVKLPTARRFRAVFDPVIDLIAPATRRSRRSELGPNDPLRAALPRIVPSCRARPAGTTDHHSLSFVDGDPHAIEGLARSRRRRTASRWWSDRLSPMNRGGVLGETRSHTWRRFMCTKAFRRRDAMYNRDVRMAYRMLVGLEMLDRVARSRLGVFVP